MERKDALHRPYVFTLINTVYLFVYALSESLDAGWGIDIFGEGDDGYNAWGTIGAIEDATCGDQGGALGSLGLFLGVAPVEAGLCNIAHYGGFCALADCTACQKKPVSIALEIEGGNAPFAMSLRADFVAWCDLKGLFFCRRK